MREPAGKALIEFYEVIERLRAPGGCPWDREQTHTTLAPYLIEEAYELLDAINSGDADAMREELGDVLLQVFMHATIAAEAETENYDIGDVAELVKQKMIHRHPHVFGDTQIGGADDVVVNWEKLKATEKKHRESLLDGIPRTLPSLAYALAIQKRPARIGFDQWKAFDDAVAGLREEVAALQIACDEAPREDLDLDWVIREGEIARGADTGAGQPPAPTSEVIAAIGKLLWTVVGTARHLRVDPEDALRQAADGYAGEFRGREKSAQKSGRDLHEMTSEEWDRLRAD